MTAYTFWREAINKIPYRSDNDRTGVIDIRQGFKINKQNELVYLTIPAFEETGLVKHCFTTRKGGVSLGECASLNTYFNVNDSRESVEKNLDILCSSLGIDFRRLVLSDQVHGDTVKIVGPEDIGKGSSRESDIKAVDALITDKPGIPLITFYADCVPLFFLDTSNHVAALAHAGWRGTVLKIGSKTLRRMTEVFGTRPEDCLAAIGPSIEGKCFEIGEDTAEAFRNSFDSWQEILTPGAQGKYFADLWKANALTLMESGIPSDNITVSGFCTKCNEELFYSYRRDKGRTGRLSAIIELLG